MSLSKKHFELLLSLEKLNTLTELAAFLNTSERNIRYQIEELNFELKKEYQIIINKQNINWQGIYMSYEAIFNNIDKIYYSFSTTERISLFILYSLIFKEEINIARYSKKMEVSKPTLKNDMKLLQEQLKNNKIYLLQNENLDYYFKYNDIDFCFFLISFLNKYIIFKENTFRPRKKSFFYSYFFKILNPNELFKINNIQTFSLQEYQNFITDEFDLIITTIDLDKKEINIPIIKVNPILTKTDIENLQRFTFDVSMINSDDFINELEKICDKLDTDELKKLLKNKYSDFFYENPSSENNNNNFIEKELFREIDEINSIEEGIKLCSLPLLEKNYITEDYIDSLIKSSLAVKNNNIYIGNHTIFPHYSNNNNVFSTKFSFLKLKKPIYFKNKYCKLIICFCTNQKNIYHDFLFKLFDILSEEEKEEKLYSLPIDEYFKYFEEI